MDKNAGYFAQRAREERLAERCSVHPKVREAHRLMAEEYERRLQLINAESERPSIHLVSAA